MPFAQRINSFVDGMLYFPGSGAGHCGFTAALLNLAADGFAVVALVTEHLFRITVDFLREGRKGSDIVRLPRRNHDADRQALTIGAGVDTWSRSHHANGRARCAPPPLSVRGWAVDVRRTCGSRSRWRLLHCGRRHQRRGYTLHRNRWRQPKRTRGVRGAYLGIPEAQAHEPLLLGARARIRLWGCFSKVAE